MVEDSDIKLIMTTADERVDMLKSVIYETLFSHEPFFDFITFSPSTGNKNYIEWVKKQTLTLAGNDPEFPDEDDEDHPDSMEGVPEPDPELSDEDDDDEEDDGLDDASDTTDDDDKGKKNKKRRKRKGKKKKGKKKGKKSSLMTVNSTQNTTADLKVEQTSNSSLKVVESA